VNNVNSNVFARRKQRWIDDCGQSIACATQPCLTVLKARKSTGRSKSISSRIKCSQ